MPFDLSITFTGLTLFVPDRDRIFALLPATPSEMRHSAEVLIDPRYLHSPPPGARGERYSHSIEGWSLDLTGLTGNSGVVALPPGLVDVGAAAGKRISRRLLGPNPDENVAARLALPPATTIVRQHGGFWDLGPQVDVEMTHSVEWTLEGVEADSLDWGLYKLRGIGADPLPELYPVDGRIAVEVRHLPDEDVPVHPPCGTKGHHFGFYYKLFGAEVNGPLPSFRAPPLEHECEPSWGTHAKVRIRHDGSFYTCMMAMSSIAGD
jgi:hypothetical protein